jgi:NADH dehydrogenase
LTLDSGFWQDPSASRSRFSPVDYHDSGSPAGDRRSGVARARVVIVGGGFGGLNAVEGLTHAPVDITLVDRNDFHTFQPLLYQVATANLDAESVGVPLRALYQRDENVTVQRALVTGVDLDTKTVTGSQGERFPYDYLVLAAGATVNYFNTPGAPGAAYPMYTLADSIRVRDRLLIAFEEAAKRPELIDDGALTIVVVGGGATGTEVAGALSFLIRQDLAKDYHDLPIDRAKVIVVNHGDALLGGFSPKAQKFALNHLTKRGVTFQLGRSVTEIHPDRVVLSDGEAIPTQTVIWAGGVSANPLAVAVGAPTGNNGRIVVGPDCSLAGHPEVFAIGDLAAIAGQDGAPLPQLAPVAIQSGEHAARQIIRHLHGEPPQPFRYFNKGIMASLGPGSAVAELPNGLTLTGRPAFYAWSGLHLAYLNGGRERLSVLLSWLWFSATKDRGARLTVGPADLSPGASMETTRTIS